MHLLPFILSPTTEPIPDGAVVLPDGAVRLDGLVIGMNASDTADPTDFRRYVPDPHVPDPHEAELHAAPAAERAQRAAVDVEGEATEADA
jgi:hypothetical protein